MGPAVERGEEGVDCDPGAGVMVPDEHIRGRERLEVCLGGVYMNDCPADPSSE